jgi:hypothetical protein
MPMTRTFWTQHIVLLLTKMREGGRQKWYLTESQRTNLNDNDERHPHDMMIAQRGSMGSMGCIGTGS